MLRIGRGKICIRNLNGKTVTGDLRSVNRKSNPSAVIFKIRKTVTKKIGFEEEFKELLRKSGIEFDERFLWK
jgi:hypothetical protein